MKTNTYPIRHLFLVSTCQSVDPQKGLVLSLFVKKIMRRIGTVVSLGYGKCIHVVMWIEDFYLLQKKAGINFSYKIIRK